MSRKLPSAVGQTIDDLRQAAAERNTANQPKAPGEAAPLAGLPLRHSMLPVEVPDIDEVVVDQAAPPETAAVHPPVPPGPGPAPVHQDALLRRSRAREIVERHATYAAAGGLVPLPIADVAAITAIIVRMVKLLSQHYGVPFERDRTRAIVLGLMGGAAPTGVAVVAATTFLRTVPGVNLIGLAVSSMAAAVCTRGVGRIFIEHFESGGTLLDVSSTKL
jgi:uncharacterized protein (DUF697 family)